MNAATAVTCNRREQPYKHEKDYLHVIKQLGLFFGSRSPFANPTVEEGAVSRVAWVTQHWLEVSLRTAREQTQSVEDALSEAGAQAITLQALDPDEPSGAPAPGASPLGAESRSKGLFAPETDAARISAELESRLGATARTARFRWIEDRDWSRAWQDHYRPMRFGRRLWVCPRQATPPGGRDAVVVRLDPGMAFGTGTHASTALCLEWLDGARLEGAKIMDYGCGSGILGIAALKLGGAELWAVDIDPRALRATRDNAAHNNVSERLETGSADDLPAAEADVVLANILAAPLITLAPALARRVRAGGHIVLSGILTRQAGEVAAAYRPWFDMEPPARRGNWVCLRGKVRA